MPERVLLLVAKTSYRSDDFMHAARRLGVDVVLGSDRCHELAKLWPDGAEPYYQAVPLDFRDRVRAVAQIAALHAERPFRAIVPTDDFTSALAAQAAERLGLSGNPASAAAAAGNKALLRQRLAAAGVPTPPAALYPVDQDPRSINPPLPCVVKPICLSASRGVIRADDRPGFAAAFRRVVAILAQPEIAALHGQAARSVLTEPFVPGPEFALEGLLDRGRLRPLALFDKPDPLDGPVFEETLYITPSRLPAGTQEELWAVTARATAALGLCEGPVHAELRLSPAGPVVLEVAARSIGGLCARTLRFGAGRSLDDIILLHALGRADEALARETAAAGVLMLPIPGRGVLREVTGVDAARALPLVEGVEITAPLGHELVPLPEGASYLGFAFARGDTPGEVEAALRQAGALIQPLIAPLLPRT
jgi:biotin carboxylase